MEEIIPKGTAAWITRPSVKDKSLPRFSHQRLSSSWRLPLFQCHLVSLAKQTTLVSARVSGFHTQDDKSLLAATIPSPVKPYLQSIYHSSSFRPSKQAANSLAQLAKPSPGTADARRRPSETSFGIPISRARRSTILREEVPRLRCLGEQNVLNNSQMIRQRQLSAWQKK